jgi:DNA-binding transcriptional MerR regulator
VNYTDHVASSTGGEIVAIEENGFLEYLQLQDGRTDLVTKSELINAVRAAGYSLSDRQLTFYMTEGLMPRSVRVGSRAGAYPAIVVELMVWILQSRDEGVPIEALRELLPVWKLLVSARNAHRLDLGELEYVARQHVASVEASIAVPRLLTDVMMRHICDECREGTLLVYKDGTTKSLGDSSATIGFAIARTPAEDAGTQTPQWFAATRLTLATPTNHSTDPTTVILGLKPNAPLPPDPVRGRGEDHPTEKTEEVRM